MKSLYSFLSRVKSASNTKLTESFAKSNSTEALNYLRISLLFFVAWISLYSNQAKGQVYLATESFDGATFVPTGWTNFLTSGTSTWTRVTAGTFPTCAPQSGAGMAKFNSYDFPGTGVRSLISPVMNFSTVGTKRISFWMYRDNGYNTTADRIEVLTNTAANTTGATLLGTINRARGLAPTVAANGWYNYTFDVTTTSATTYLILQARGAYGNNIYIDNVGVAAPPSCSAPSALTSSNITSTTATISWTAASPAPASGYQYFYSTSATAPTAGTTPSGSTAAGVVTANITGLTANTTYYFWVRGNCGGSGTSTWAGSGAFFTGYCQPTGTGANTSITNVVTSGGITNLSNASGFTAGGYANFTAQSCSQSPGVAINFTLNYVSDPGTRIFIDWNNDLDFNDAGEIVYSSNGYVLSTVSGSFTVPVGQAAGSYRMRIVADWNATLPIACPVGINGETEDYTFTVVPLSPCAGTPTPGNTISSPSFVAAPSGNVNLSLQNATVGTGVTYQWQSASTQTGTYSNIVGATSSTYTATVSSITWFRCVVTCSGNSGTSNPVQVTLTACIPTMTYGCTDGDVIARVILNTLDNNSGTGCPSGTLGYSNYTTNAALTTTLQPSTSYNCIVYAGQYAANYAAWIDYNDNLVFEASERIGYTLSTVAGSGFVGVLGSSASFPVTLACTPPAGQHLLRIREVYNQTSGVTITPCGNNEGFGFGEIEDYMITIAPAPACPTPGLVSNVTPSSNSVALTWATSCSSATSYDFEYGPAGFTLGLGTLVSNQTVTISAPNASYTVTGLQAGTNYDIYYRANCGSSTSAWSLTSNFSTPNSVSAASSTPTLCQGTVLTSITHNTQGATGIGTATGLPSGVTAAWSSNIITISGTPTVSGVFSYSIPLTGGFGSLNATGTITVLAAPIAPTATSPQVFCETANATIASLQVSGAAGSTFAWYTAAAGGAALSSSTELSLGTTNYFVESIGTNGCVSLIRTSVSVTENPLLSASVSITGTTACPGGVLLFTATPVNGGTSPTYQWYNNGVVIPNETASTYSASGLLAGDVINVKMIPSGSCVTVCP